MSYIRAIVAIACCFLAVTIIYIVNNSETLFGFACEGVETCFSELSLESLALPILATIFAVFGTLAAAAYCVAMRKNLKEVGFTHLLRLAVGSTDFALSIFVFPLLFLVVINAVTATDDIVLALTFSFETGFVSKSLLSALSKAKRNA